VMKGVPTLRLASILVALALASAVPTGTASSAELPVVPGDTVQVTDQALSQAALAFALAFASGSGDRLSGSLANGGIRLHLHEAGHTGLSTRQAVASIREFVRGYEDAAAIVMRAASIEGSPDRGFAEVMWEGRVSGTSQGVRRTLFVGLMRESGEWVVDEVRLLR
jgi:hypothetical protein